MNTAANSATEGSDQVDKIQAAAQGLCPECKIQMSDRGGLWVCPCCGKTFEVAPEGEELV